MSRNFIHSLVLASLFVTSVASAQSTISNRPWELITSKGAWVGLLPAYELGTNANGAPAFRDNLDDVGYIGQTKLVRRFLGTRTSFEAKGYFAFAQSISSTDVIDVDIPNPETGVNNALSGGRTHMRSKIANYGVDIALRDTWRTQYGGLSAGGAFSYMRFDQRFDPDYGIDRLFREDLDADYLGGKVFVGWDGCFHGRPSAIDFAVGLFDMDGDYRFLGNNIAGSLEREISKTATTIEASFTTHTNIHGYQLSWTFGGMYITDMPTIQHNAGSAVTLDTDDAATLNAMIEWLL